MLHLIYTYGVLIIFGIFWILKQVIFPELLDNTVRINDAATNFFRRF